MPRRTRGTDEPHASPPPKTDEFSRAAHQEAVYPEKYSNTADRKRRRNEFALRMRDYYLQRTEADILEDEETEEFEALAVQEIDKIVERLDIGIAEERKAMDVLLSRLRTTRIVA